MAAPNYQYEKRQREIAKKKKRDEKLQAKMSKSHTDAVPNNALPADIISQRKILK